MSAHRAVTGVEERVSAFARAIALKRAAVTGTVGAGLMLAVAMGWITPDMSDDYTAWVESGLALLTTVGAGAWIHQGTTPADSGLEPVNSDGVPLVPDPGIADAVLGEDDPDIAAAVLDGTKRPLVTLPEPVDWSAQEHRYPPKPDLNGSTAIAGRPESAV